MIRRTAALRLAVALLAMTGVPGCVSAPVAAAPVGHGEMQFVGTWSGEVDGDGDGVVAMVITEAAADGTSFAGDLTYAADGSEITAPLAGAMTPHGHLVVGVGDETASVEAHITDPETLDYCFVRYGFDPVYSCGRLVRAK